MARPPDNDEYAVTDAPERAVLRHGKGRPMKALLLKKWGANYAGQVLTNVEKGSIPAGVAEFYEDDAPTPNDVVKDPTPAGVPLTVTNDALDPEQVAAATKAQDAKMEAAKKAEEAAAKQADEQAAEKPADKKKGGKK